MDVKVENESKREENIRHMGKQSVERDIWSKEGGGYMEVSTIYHIMGLIAVHTAIHN